MRNKNVSRILVLGLFATLATACGKKEEFPVNSRGTGIKGDGSTANVLASEWNVLKGAYNGTISVASGTQNFNATIGEAQLGGSTYATMAIASSGSVITGLNQSMYLGFINRTTTASGTLAYYNFISQVLMAPTWSGGKNVAFQLGLALSYVGQTPTAAHNQSWMELLECRQNGTGWVCDQEFRPGLEFSFF